MSIVLSLNDINYKDILKNVSFSLEENTFNILTGPVGCGKSTLVNCILNQIKYSGNIYIDDFITLKVMDSTLKFTQKLPIDNISQSIENFGYKSNEARKIAYDIAKKLGITDILFKDSDKLSYSEKKMVLFAGVVAPNSKIIVIDDPLDINDVYREKAIKFLKKISKNCTILFITNNEEDYLLADNIILMNDGTVLACNQKEKIFADEKVLYKCNTKLPFICDLSNRLKIYDLVDKNYYNFESLIDDLWK